jgi:hypothetical protein
VNIRVAIPVFLMAVMAVVVAIAFRYPYVQAKLSILVCGGLVLVLAMVQLSRELRHRRGQAAKEPGAGALRYITELSWMAGFGVAIYIIGFIPAIPFCVCFYMKSHGSTWLSSILTGVLMSACCYGIFVLFLDMRLHWGIIFPEFGP